MAQAEIDTCCVDVSLLPVTSDTSATSAGSDVVPDSAEPAPKSCEMPVEEPYQPPGCTEITGDVRLEAEGDLQRLAGDDRSAARSPSATTRTWLDVSSTDNAR